MERTLYPVILVGGRGARLWPVSRESLPKVFQNLTSDKSLLQDTCARLGGIKKIGAPVVVCNTDHTFLVREQLANIKDLTILAEPVRRNTAPAIVAAGALLQKRDPNAIMLVLPADHVITNPAAFHRAVETAVAVAGDGHLVTFGITPKEAETEYGYIKSGKALDDRNGACEIERFVEKPDADKAQKMLDEGGYSWNSGMFVFPVRDMFDDLRSFAPDVLSAAVSAVPFDAPSDGIIHLNAEQFESAPAISIDYALMEKTSRAAVVSCDIGWSDVGNWNALWNLGVKDDSGNVLVGDAISQESENSLLRSDGPLVVGVGLKDIVVVATDDAVLVGDQSQIRTVNQAVDRLAAEKRRQAESHNRAYLPWGYAETIERGARFQVKRLSVNPGAKISLHKHIHRAEHWTVVEGSGLVIRDDEEILLNENESISLPLGCLHRVENPGNVLLTIIEIQYGSYLDDDDVVRIDDIYGRI